LKNWLFADQPLEETFRSGRGIRLRKIPTRANEFESEPRKERNEDADDEQTDKILRLTLTLCAIRELLALDEEKPT
jgi:hypothetical protein